MNFSAFPTRGIAPPPVPPKTSPTGDFSTSVTSGNTLVSHVPPPPPPGPSDGAHPKEKSLLTKGIQKPKKVRPSLTKSISIDSLLNFYTNSRKSPRIQPPPTPTASDERPAAATQDATSARPGGDSNATVASNPSLRALRDKQRAKGGLMDRNGGSQPGIVTMVTVQEACMDSPTIPGRPPMFQEWESSNSGRRGASRGAPASSENLLLSTAAYTERPISPPATPQPPHTPWLASEGGPPQVPPKPGVILQKIPPFPQPRSPAVPERRPTVVKKARQAGGDSTAKRQIEIPRPDSADSAMPPARWLKRQQSSASPALSTKGARPPKAPIHLHSQIEWQRTAAMIVSEEFNILGEKDVEALSRELSLLEAQCQYLRETHRSLRSGRRTLHKGIVTYLKSARSTVFSRESLLRQEEALAELDASIDDWHLKLEKANDRRARVKEKLHEHLAAALAVPSCACSPRGMSTRLATPAGKKQVKFEGQESITIYALRADIEQGSQQVKSN